MDVIKEIEQRAGKPLQDARSDLASSVEAAHIDRIMENAQRARDAFTVGWRRLQIDVLMGNA